MLNNLLVTGVVKERNGLLEESNECTCVLVIVLATNGRLAFLFRDVLFVRGFYD